MSPLRFEVRLDKSFVELSGLGLIARTRYLCCERCTWERLGSELDSILLQTPDMKNEFAGAVFWPMTEVVRMMEQNVLHLYYGPIETERHGVVGKTHEEIGNLVCKVLGRHGLFYRWGGDPKQPIVIAAV